MMQNFFGNSFASSCRPALAGRTIPSLHGASLIGGMNRLLEDPFDDFFCDMPALGCGTCSGRPHQAGDRRTTWSAKEEQKQLCP